jgi:uncharacterized protein YjbJ (UPF0337 family)
MRWDRLTEDDVAHIKGHCEVLIACLQERYGYASELAQEEVREWEHRLLRRLAHIVSPELEQVP